MTPPRIEEIHRSKTGKVSDKWSSYLGYYDRLLAPLRTQPLAMLEIGVQNGGSLETWAMYFEQATAIIGCDIDPRCSVLRYADPRVRVVVGDANAAATYRDIVGMAPALDLVIDDGSHRSLDVINAFLNYFPRLVPGGIYIVEDAHCLYMDDFGGGLLHEQGAYAFFKRLVDVVSYQFWERDVSLANWMRSFFSASALPAFIAEGWIESIEFRNSIITIHKAHRPGHAKLGERLTVGSETAVQDWAGRRPAGA